MGGVHDADSEPGWATLRGALVRLRDAERFAVALAGCRLTQTEVAVRAGISHTTISRMKTGHLTAVKRSTASRIAEVVGVELFVLFVPDESADGSKKSSDRRCPECGRHYRDSRRAALIPDGRL